MRCHLLWERLYSNTPLTLCDTHDAPRDRQRRRVNGTKEVGDTSHTVKERDLVPAGPCVAHTPLLLTASQFTRRLSAPAGLPSSPPPSPAVPSAGAKCLLVSHTTPCSRAPLKGSRPWSTCSGRGGARAAWRGGRVRMRVRLEGNPSPSLSPHPSPDLVRVEEHDVRGKG